MLAAAVGDVFGTASCTVAGARGGLGAVFAMGAGISDLGEQAAMRTTPNSGVIAIKRLRVAKVVMSIFLENNVRNFSLGLAVGHPGLRDLVSELRWSQSGALASVQCRTVELPVGETVGVS